MPAIHLIHAGDPDGWDSTMPSAALSMKSLPEAAVNLSKRQQIRPTICTLTTESQMPYTGIWEYELLIAPELGDMYTWTRTFSRLTPALYLSTPQT